MDKVCIEYPYLSLFSLYNLISFTNLIKLIRDNLVYIVITSFLQKQSTLPSVQ